MKPTFILGLLRTHRDNVVTVTDHGPEFKIPLATLTDHSFHPTRTWHLYSQPVHRLHREGKLRVVRSDEHELVLAVAVDPAAEEASVPPTAP